MGKLTTEEQIRKLALAIIADNVQYADEVILDIDDGEPEGEGYRYFASALAALCRIRRSDGRDEAWLPDKRRWRYDPEMQWTPEQFHACKTWSEITESEAVERFGREILDSDEASNDGKTEHQRALEKLDLKPGDRVRVERRVNHGCLTPHESAVGKVGTVVEVSNGPRGDGSVKLSTDPSKLWIPPRPDVLTLESRASDEPPKPTTLAEVEPYVLCEVELCEGIFIGLRAWRDGEEGRVVMENTGEHEPWVTSFAAKELHVRRILGPVRVEVADAE